MLYPQVYSSVYYFGFITIYYNRIHQKGFKKCPQKKQRQVHIGHYS